MIDVCQWRASIGLWNYCQAASSRPANGHHSHSFKAAVDSKSGSTTSGEKTSKLQVALSLIAFLLLLYFSSSRHISIPITSITSYNQVQCTTVTGMNCLQSVTERSSFNVTFYESRLITLLLSGDIELNPGPKIERARKRIKDILQSHHYDIQRATSCSLEDIIPQLYAKNIITESVKDSMNYSSMMREFDTKITLTKNVSGLKLLCEVFLECICQGGPTDDMIETLAVKWNKIFDTKLLLPGQMTRIPSLTPSPSPVSLARSTVSLSKTKAAEIKVQESLDDLHKNFSRLITELQSVLEEKAGQNIKFLSKISKWVKCYVYWEPIIIESSLDDIFKKIDPYYDFIDCKLILDTSKAFLSDRQTSYIVDEFKSHALKAKALTTSITIQNLKKALKQKYEPFETDIHNMPVIQIKLKNDWGDINIEGLKLLIKKLLPMESRQSLIKYISIRSGSVYIIYQVRHCRSYDLIKHTEEKLQFMRLIGIISIYINGYHVLQEKNKNFTFELALLEAVTVGNNEAVEFLLQLKTLNIDHTNDKGETALILACKGGHEDIVYNLLSAGANVDIKDNKRWTALMIASEHNHISIIHMLLQANANPHLKTPKGFNAIMIAGFHGNYEAVRLLIREGVDYEYQQEDGWNALMMACQNGFTKIVELLLKVKVDPNVQEKDGWNALMIACKNGRTQIVELLLKKKIDPDVQNKDGLNALMVACQN